MTNKESKEFKAIKKALIDYIMKHGDDCYVNLSIGAFDTDCNVVDDGLFRFGHYEDLIIDMKANLEEFRKDKNKYKKWFANYCSIW